MQTGFVGNLPPIAAWSNRKAFQQTMISDDIEEDAGVLADDSVNDTAPQAADCEEGDSPEWPSRAAARIQLILDPDTLGGLPTDHPKWFGEAETILGAWARLHAAQSPISGSSQT